MKKKRFTEGEKIELAKAVQVTDIGCERFRRVQAVYWKSQGRTGREVIELSGFSQATITRMCASYKESGLEGLRPKRIGANNRKLTHEQEAHFLNEVSEKARAGDFVRSKEAKELFEEKSGKSYHINAFRQLLYRHGWRKIVPRPKHPDAADKEACEAAKKLTINTDS